MSTGQTIEIEDFVMSFWMKVAGLQSLATVSVHGNCPRRFLWMRHLFYCCPVIGIMMKMRMKNVSVLITTGQKMRAVDALECISKTLPKVVVVVAAAAAGRRRLSRRRQKLTHAGRACCFGCRC